MKIVLQAFRLICVNAGKAKFDFMLTLNVSVCEKVLFLHVPWPRSASVDLHAPSSRPCLMSLTAVKPSERKGRGMIWQKSPSLSRWQVNRSCEETTETRRINESFYNTKNVDVPLYPLLIHTNKINKQNKIILYAMLFACHSNGKKT